MDIMRILAIADLHVGSLTDVEYMYDVTTAIFEQEILFKRCDMVVFLGDYFDKVFKVNEEYTTLAINLMNYLVRMCMGRTKIRMIYGTESHEMNQYKLFNCYLDNPDIDFKVFYTVTDEYVNGKNILYIPEEFIEDRKEYYQEYFKKEYDYIFGHGVITEGFPMEGMMRKPKGPEKRVPHFRSYELLDICKICLFGHYHVHNDYYLGSLFRTKFGESDPKGYGIIDNYDFTFMENHRAYIFDTVIFEEDSNVYQSNEILKTEITNIKDHYKDIFNGNRRGKIRLEFHLPPDLDTSFKEIIRSMLFNEKHITLLIKESSQLLNEVKESIEEEYDYILDSIPLEEKLHRHIHEENKDFELTLDKLKKYIHEPLEI